MPADEDPMVKDLFIRMAGDFTPLSPDQEQALLWDTPVVKHMDPGFHEGTPEDRRKYMDDLLNMSQEELNRQFEEAKKAYGDRMLNREPAPAGRIRGAPGESIPAFKEYLQNLPDDVEAHDLGAKGWIFRKKTPLTS